MSKKESRRGMRDRRDLAQVIFDMEEEYRQFIDRDSDVLKLVPISKGNQAYSAYVPVTQDQADVFETEPFPVFSMVYSDDFYVRRNSGIYIPETLSQKADLGGQTDFDSEREYRVIPN